MVANIVIDYLLNKGMISEEQGRQIFDELSHVRARLGLIAVHEGLITEYQADTVNMLQATRDKKFGDLAIEMGLLTGKQVEELLMKQGDPYLSLGQSLENLGIMRFSDLDQVMKKYQAENRLTTSSIEAIKSDETDRIVPLFMPENSSIYCDIVILAMNTIQRMIDVHILPRMGFFTDKLETEKGALQFVDGDPCLTTCFACDGDGLIDVASIYGREEFESVDMDALDAIAEFINCINGMYASKASLDRVRMELYPPSFNDSISGVVGSMMLVMPIVICGREIKLVFCVGDRLDLE